MGTNRTANSGNGLDQFGGDAAGGRGPRLDGIERGDGAAVRARDRQMKRVAGSEVEVGAIDEGGGSGKVRGGDRKRDQACRAHHGPRRLDLGPLVERQLPGADFDRQRRGEFGHRPVADRQRPAVLRLKP